MLNKTIFFSIILVLIMCCCSKIDDSLNTLDPQLYSYDFNDNDLSSWDGTANAEIINGQLHLSSVQGYWWHTIEYDSSTHFVEGDIEVEIYPQNGSYSFQTKGNTLSSGILEWSIFTLFRRDSLFVRQFIDGSVTPVYTDFIYEKNTWYYLRYKFNNEAGEQGKFDFWITEMDNESSEIYLGNFDYGARYGRLEGINQFVLAAGDPDGSVIMEGIFDNVEFNEMTGVLTPF